MLACEGGRRVACWRWLWTFSAIWDREARRGEPWRQAEYDAVLITSPPGNPLYPDAILPKREECPGRAPRRALRIVLDMFKCRITRL